MRDRELGHQRIEHRLAQIRCWLGNLEYCTDVLLNCQTAKYRSLLREVADAESRPPVHRKIRDVAPIQADHPGIGGNEPGYDVEARRFSRAVRPEQANHFASMHGDVDAAQHRPSFEALAQSPPDQTAIVGDQPRPPLAPSHPGIGTELLVTPVHGFRTPRGVDPEAVFAAGTDDVDPSS